MSLDRAAEKGGRRPALLAGTIFIALAVLAGACGGDGTNAVTLTRADSGTAVQVAPAQVITLTLESNRTTGFRWQLVGRPDAAVLRLVSSEYVAPEGGLVGEGGTEVWTFESVSRGATSLGLAYSKPFEPDAVAGKFNLTITVQ